MKKNILIGLVIVLFVAVTLAGCSQDAPGTAPGDDNAALESDGRIPYSPDDHYIYVGCMWNLEYFIAHKLGWEYAGEVLGVKTSIMGPAEYDIPAMISAFESAIAMEPKGIVTFAVDPELIPVINQAVDAGIPVVTLDGDQPESKRLTFVGTNPYDAGYFGGMNLAQIIDEGEVAILTIVGVPMFVERERGYRDAMEKYSNGKLQIVAQGDTKADIPTGISVAKSILAANPDLDAFVCVDSTGAISAATAIKEAGLEGEVAIIGMDRNNDVLEEIRNDVITASVAQQSALMPFYGLHVLFNYNYRHVPITDDNLAAGITGAPQFIYTGQIWVDDSNYEYFFSK